MTLKQSATHFAISVLTLLSFCAVARATTCPLPTTVGVVICTPDNEDVVASPVEISAAGKGKAELRTWKIYIDGLPVWTSPLFVDSINPILNLAGGQHRVTAKVWDVNGSTYSKTIYISVSTGSIGCPATVDRTVVICNIYPPRGGRITVTADAADRLPISAMKLYMNGSAVCSKSAAELAANGGYFSCAPYIQLVSGLTRFTVKAWDSLGSFSVTKYVNLP